MKVRRGFVSNSSSSSFVVAFPKVPENEDELQKMLFDEDQTVYPDPFETGGFSVSTVASTVYEDITKSKPLSPQEITKELSCGSLKGCPRCNDFIKDKDTLQVDWNKYQEAIEKHAAKVAFQFIEDNPDATFYCFHYSDHNGNYGCALEHGDLFHKLKYIRISHH